MVVLLLSIILCFPYHRQINENARGSIGIEFNLIFFYKGNLLIVRLLITISEFQ